MFYCLIEAAEPAPFAHRGTLAVWEWEVGFSILPLLKLSFIKEFISVIRFYTLTRLFVSGLIGEIAKEWRVKDRVGEENENWPPLRYFIFKLL